MLVGGVGGVSDGTDRGSVAAVPVVIGRDWDGRCEGGRDEDWDGDCLGRRGDRRGRDGGGGMDPGGPMPWFCWGGEPSSAASSESDTVLNATMQAPLI